jgi:hypothetical protein
MALKVSIDLDERIIERHQPKPIAGQAEHDADIAALAAAVKSARSEALAIVNLDAAGTPLLAVATAAVKSAERVAPRLDQARSRVLATIATLRKTTAAPPAPTTAGAASMEKEIRASLSKKTKKQRDAILNSAFAAKDLTTIGAVLHGPYHLVEMSETEHGMLGHRYAKQFHQVESARIERLTKALEAAERAGTSFVRLVREASDSPTARLEASNAQRREEAAAAHAALNAEAE